MTLTEFLLARIAEDEAQAVLVSGAEGVEWAFTVYPHDGESIPLPTPALHPARVLAECEAKRRIVELHQPQDPDDERVVCSLCFDPDTPAGDYYFEGWPCDTLLALALPYADHPDYREEWRA